MGLKNRQENWNSGEGEGENISCVVVGGGSLPYPVGVRQYEVPRDLLLTSVQRISGSVQW